MSVSDDVLSFEEQLRRLVLEAIDAAEKFDGDIGGPTAYVLGYVMGGARFDTQERRDLFARLIKLEETR